MRQLDVSNRSRDRAIARTDEDLDARDGSANLATDLLMEYRGGDTMTVLDRVYSRFARDHYVRRPLRRPEHVEAVLKAAAIPPTKVDETFWRQIRPDWFWGVSATPFEGARHNAAYRRHCARRGVQP
jgi:hypothetical protein